MPVFSLENPCVFTDREKSLFFHVKNPCFFRGSLIFRATPVTHDYLACSRWPTVLARNAKSLNFLSYVFFQVINGYFVHHFSPEGIPPVRKHVVFVIDESNSMRGWKILQTREAMITILDQLNEGDTYNIVTFETGVKTWEADKMVPVTPTTIERGKTFAMNLQAKQSKL